MLKNRNEESIELFNRLIKVFMFLQKTGNRQLINLGLNQSQFSVLCEISQKCNLSQKDILGDFLLEKSNLSKIIKKLEQMELITIKTPDSDKRKTVLNATEKGKNLFNKGKDELDKLKVLFTAPLELEEFNKLYDATQSLENLVNHHLSNN